MGTDRRHIRLPVRFLFLTRWHIPTSRTRQMKPALLLLSSSIIWIFVLSSCASGPNINDLSPTTATPCATSVTILSGQTTSATLMPNQPTFSPEMQATAEARLRQANPGNPPYPGASQAVSQLPPCPTSTPAATPRPQTPQGGFAQGTLAPQMPTFSSDQMATIDARMRLANPGAPTTPH